VSALLILALLFSVGALVAYDGLTREPPELRERRTGLVARTSARLRLFLRAAGVGASVRTFVVYSVGCGVGCAWLAQVLLGWPVTTLVASVIGTGLLAALYAPRATRRRAAERAALPELADQLRVGFAAGQSIEQRLVGLAANGPEALRPELVRLVWRLRLADFDVAMRDFRDRLADPLADEVCAALILGHTLGSKELGSVLARLADTTRQRLALRQEGIARQAQVRLSARYAVIIPVLTLVGIRILSPEYLVIYDGPVGQLVLLGCFAWLLTGYGVLLWLGRLPDARRVLMR
jgi:tight adherence protein B